MVTTAVTSVGKRPWTTVEAGLFLDQFARSLRAENKAPTTVFIYTSAVAQFAEHLERTGMPIVLEHISREHVENFINHLLATAKPATANNRYRGLQAYFKWAVGEGEITQSPMVNMRPPKLDEQPPDVLSDADIHRLLKACAGTSFPDRRDTAIIRILLDTGLRRAELAGLTLDDVDLDNQTLRVRGKGGRYRQPCSCRRRHKGLSMPIITLLAPGRRCEQHRQYLTRRRLVWSANQPLAQCQACH